MKRQLILKAFSKKTPRGFSLIEIMVALLLLGLIAGAISVAMMGQLERGRKQAARTQAMELAKALDIYRLQLGHYPTDAEGGLEALVNPPKGEPLIDSLPKDPWGNDYQMVYPPEHNRNKPDVFSFGPDGESSEEKLGNWEESK